MGDVCGVKLFTLFSFIVSVSFPLCSNSFFCLGKRKPSRHNRTQHSGLPFPHSLGLAYLTLSPLECMASENGS